VTAKPFLKWAGGKAQLLEQFRECYPKALITGKIHTYIEPFVGGGAVFFDIAQMYAPQKAYLYDCNEELVLAYNVIKKNPDALIRRLKGMVKQYHACDENERKEFFYRIREKYNRTKKTISCDVFSARWITRAAQLIFLNKTCFNGLYRVNSTGGFNVPFGKYRQPGVFDPQNIRAVSTLLQNAEIRCGDFTECENLVDADTFVYFDPPYRPVSKTSSFTSYAGTGFDDNEQIRLHAFFQKLDAERGPLLMLSNSDPKNVNKHDTFFEDLYKGYSICRVYAKRSINSNAAKRGEISELVITNY